LPATSARETVAGRYLRCGGNGKRRRISPGEVAVRPIPAEGFSRIVGRIYECALDPGLWSPTLDAVAAAIRCQTACMVLHEMTGDRLLLDLFSGVPADDVAALDAIAHLYPDRWGGAARYNALPPDAPSVLSRVNPASCESRISQEWYEPRGLVDNLMIGFAAVQGARTEIGFGRHRDEGLIGDDEIALARLFVPHLKRSLAIGRLLEARAVERATFAAVLDGLAFGVLLVGPGLRLLHANRAGEALLRAGDPLGLRFGRVTAPGALAEALQAALTASRGLGIPARRGDGEELVIHLLPLAGASPLPGATAALFIAPAIHPRPAPLAAIAALFDLTATETRVLELIGAGRANAEIAAALGIAVSTVRTHVLRLFEKTGTHRRAGLGALLAAFSLPLA
jgi:DNA-binding CsgD family transcriptional regulator